MKRLLNILTLLFCLQIGDAQPVTYLTPNTPNVNRKKELLPLENINATKGTLPREVRVEWPSKGDGCTYLVYRAESGNN
jgi:hypothetical protein